MTGKMSANFRKWENVRPILLLSVYAADLFVVHMGNTGTRVRAHDTGEKISQGAMKTL